MVRPKNKIRLSKSCIDNIEKKAVLNVLDHEYLGLGGEVHDFEKKLEKILKRKVSCVSSGTAALHLALQALGLNTGDEVLVQSLTYVASFQAISATGAMPVPCKVDPETLCIDCKDAEKRITNKTKVIMPVHYSGGVGNLDNVYLLAKKYNLRVVEDAAHAFGSFYRKRMVGSFGDIVCFSFDGIKNITSGEGGCVVTNDSDIIKTVEDARLLGVCNDTSNRFSGKRSWNFDVNAQGWRYHMSNIMAAIGISQLSKLKHFSNIRQSLAKQYDSMLKENPNIKIIKHDYNEVVPHIYVVRLNEKINRNELVDKLSDAGIQTGVHYHPNHKLSYYKHVNVKNNPILQNYIFNSLLTLPLHTDLTVENITYICNQLNNFTCTR